MSRKGPKLVRYGPYGFTIWHDAIPMSNYIKIYSNPSLSIEKNHESIELLNEQNINFLLRIQSASHKDILRQNTEAIFAANLLPNIMEREPVWSTVHRLCPKPGDLIEFDRIWYKHWALYMGDGNVVHFNPKSGEFEKKNAIKFVIGSIEKAKLTKVAENSSRTRVNNKSNSNPKNFTDINNMVDLLLDNTESKLYYNLSDFNCEHFVTFLKFGVAFSDQVIENRDALATGMLIGPSPMIGIPLYIAANVSSVTRHFKCQAQWEENVRAARTKEAPKFLM